MCKLCLSKGGEGGSLGEERREEGKVVPGKILIRLAIQDVQCRATNAHLVVNPAIVWRYIVFVEKQAFLYCCKLLAGREQRIGK